MLFYINIRNLKNKYLKFLQILQNLQKCNFMFFRKGGYVRRTQQGHKSMTIFGLKSQKYSCSFRAIGKIFKKWREIGMNV